MRSVVLGQGGEIDGSIPQERAEQGGSQERQVARATGVAAQFVVMALELVQLLDDRHGQDHGIVGKGGDGIGVVQKDIGVEDKILFQRQLLEWMV